jgi:zinc transport system substrate-binding protein
MKKTSKQFRITISVIFIAAVATALAWVAIANRTDDGSDKLAVSASYYPLYEFTKQVGGGKVAVTNMTPTGADSHDYEPSAREIAQAQNAAVFVYNGAGFESWSDGFLADYHGQVVNASQGVDLLDAEHGHHEDEEGHHGEHGHEDEHHEEESHEAEDVHAEESSDPHFWLDPLAAPQIVNNIRDGLIAADPDNADYYTENAASYNRQLAQLDQEFDTSLQSCQQTKIVTSHNAFSYVAERYGFEIKSIAGQSHDDEPSASELAEITDFVRGNNIQFILAEQLAASNLTDTIAQETGAQTLLLDPIEGINDESQNYIALQRQNLQNLQRALACN